MTEDNYVEKRAPFRNQHLSLAQQAFENGTLVLGGAYADSPDGAMLIFKGEDSSVAENFAKNDPYVKNGLVKEWQIRQWIVVVGGK
jgi:uncharacterized protein YciI